MSDSSVFPIDVARKAAVAFMKMHSSSPLGYCVGLAKSRDEAQAVIEKYASEPDVSIVLHCDTPKVAALLRDEFVNFHCDRISGCPTEQSPFLYLYMRPTGSGPPDLSRQAPA